MRTAMLIGQGVMLTIIGYIFVMGALSLAAKVPLERMLP